MMAPPKGRRPILDPGSAPANVVELFAGLNLLLICGVFWGGRVGGGGGVEQASTPPILVQILDQPLKRVTLFTINVVAAKCIAQL